jgi:hypothetical protein
VSDLITFISDVALIILNQLPLQSLDSATVLAYSYLSDTGGWVPDDPLNPNGPGQPFNGETEQEFADAITIQQFDTIYDINFTVTLTLNLQAITKLTDGLSLNDAAASMVNQVSDFITDSINNSPLPLRVESTSTQVTDSDRSIVGGYTIEDGNTTQALRQIIDDDLTDFDTIKDIDYKSLALLYVRNTYGLDHSWNVHSIYTEIDNPITIIIRKYVDQTYAALDTNDLTVYVMNVSPTTYQVVTGVIIA